MPEGPPEPKKRGGYAKGDARKQQILDRAIEVFAQRGANRTSLRAIAEAVGVTHGTLVHHFGSLDELLVAVYTASDKALDERIALFEDPTPVEIMIESARANRAVPGLVQLYSTLMAAALEEGHPAATDFAKNWFATVREDLTELVREHQQAGRIRGDLDPRAVASLVIAASDGLQTQWLLDDTAPQDEALSILESLLRAPS
ncbi:TetR/AcrR family transcriptional regulator [Microbacterium thalassium]|uniref:AcrR family transcriptional regulator n=1 Tax=Microbacterium thalassium TaxID=362649 RepID=A0A7X0FMG1_9MICO|nr:TetR/AcrR family transcriptional regulator [Microbacterium thalassium]MBB6390188.1 AcrR family transcriptional regulator [Microbacterium thalassium]GLK25296.1 TetR family transcriptional regulator [Microbacterium thalassium]